jgi:hypothetical protein
MSQTQNNMPHCCENSTHIYGHIVSQSKISVNFYYEKGTDIYRLTVSQRHNSVTHCCEKRTDFYRYFVFQRHNSVTHCCEKRTDFYRLFVFQRQLCKPQLASPSPAVTLFLIEEHFLVPSRIMQPVFVLLCSEPPLFTRSAVSFL